MWRFLIAVVSSLALVGCTTVHAIRAPISPTSSSQFEAGEEIEVVLRTGKVQALKYIAIDRHSIIGFSGKQRVAIALTDVREIRHSDLSIGKSIGAAAIVLGVMLFAYLVIVGMRFSD